MMTRPDPRPLHAIAADIRAAWPDPTGAACLWLRAMDHVATCTDRHHTETGATIITGFLEAARHWTGPAATAYKTELADIYRRHSDTTEEQP